MSTPNADLVADVGQDKGAKQPTDKYDGQHGTYEDGVDKHATEDRLPTTNMPRGPEPSPFTLGPMAPGGRGE